MSLSFLLLPPHHYSYLRFTLMWKYLLPCFGVCNVSYNVAGQVIPSLAASLFSLSRTKVSQLSPYAEILILSNSQSTCFSLDAMIISPHKQSIIQNVTDEILDRASVQLYCYNQRKFVNLKELSHLLCTLCETIDPRLCGVYGTTEHNKKKPRPSNPMFNPYIHIRCIGRLALKRLLARGYLLQARFSANSPREVPNN